MRYLVVIEKTPRNYSAYSPDVPGCVATGRTLDETKTKMREALESHLEVMAEYGGPAPEPTAWAISIHGYNVPIERIADGYRAEPPDLPDVVATADTPERIEALIRDAIASRIGARRAGRSHLNPPLRSCISRLHCRALLLSLEFEVVHECRSSYEHIPGLCHSNFRFFSIGVSDTRLLACPVIHVLPCLG